MTACVVTLVSVLSKYYNRPRIQVLVRLVRALVLRVSAASSRQSRPGHVLSAYTS